MKAALFLATKKGYYCLETLIKNNYSQSIGFVSSFKETNVEKSYDEDIKMLCDENNIRFIQWGNLKNSLQNELINNQISISFAIGWKFLIDTKINEFTEHGLVVFHDSLLPKYKGFAPTPTAIICGEEIIGVSAIKAADGTDNGDIILQKRMSISEDEYVAEIIDRQCILYSEMVSEIISLANNNRIVLIPQDESTATYSIWRNPEDCLIDWSKSSKEIYNLIRAVSNPYPGAYTFYKDNKIIINKASIIQDMSFAIRDYGKLWAINGNKASVICGDGMLLIENASYEDGTSVIFDKLRERLK